MMVFERVSGRENRTSKGPEVCKTLTSSGTQRKPSCEVGRDVVGKNRPGLVDQTQMLEFHAKGEAIERCQSRRDIWPLNVF